MTQEAAEAVEAVAEAAEAAEAQAEAAEMAEASERLHRQLRRQFRFRSRSPQVSHHSRRWRSTRRGWRQSWSV